MTSIWMSTWGSDAVDLDDVDDDIAEKIQKNLDKYGLDWEKLPEKKQRQIVEGSKELDRQVRQRLGQRLS